MNANNIVMMKILNIVSSTIPLCHYQLHTSTAWCSHGQQHWRSPVHVGLFGDKVGLILVLDQRQCFMPSPIL